MSDKPLEVEVIAHVLGSMDHCPHCQVFIDGVGIGDQIHVEDLNSFPDEWMSEWQRVSDLILSVAEHYAGRLVIKVTDAQTPKAMWLALRRGVRKYPTFIVGADKYQGLSQERVEALIDRHLSGAQLSSS